MTGNDLKALRKVLRLTQAAMAEEMGLSLRAYTDLEKTVSDLRRDHQMVAELVSLRQAVAKRDLNLAFPEVRKMALEYARLLETGNPEAHKGRASW